MPCADGVARPPGVDDERPPAGPPEHQRGAQPGGAAADDDAVPLCRFHAPRMTAPRCANLRCHAGKAAGAAEATDVRVRRRLRELRTERGLTLKQVAERAHIDVSTLSRLGDRQAPARLDHVPAWPPPSA